MTTDQQVFTGYGGQEYTYKGSGTNSQNNHFCIRSYSPSAENQNNYHYSNSDGSYYYQNPDGSRYYNNENGFYNYTRPSSRDVEMSDEAEGQQGEKETSEAEVEDENDNGQHDDITATEEQSLPQSEETNSEDTYDEDLRYNTEYVDDSNESGLHEEIYDEDDWNSDYGEYYGSADDLYEDNYDDYDDYNDYDDCDDDYYSDDDY